MARPRPPWVRWAVRHLAHPLEAAVVYAFYGLFRALPVDAASALGGWIGRTVGPWLPGTRTARRNLALALPERAGDHAAIVRGMWDNLGRVFAEYPHLPALAGRIEIVGARHIEDLSTDGRAGIMVSGHLANWEVLTVAAHSVGVGLSLVYRAPNNPYVDRLLLRTRAAFGATAIPKGAEGARTILRGLNRGDHVGMLIDQKLNDGIAVPFFGHAAMTAPAAAMFALKFRLPLVPVRIERTGGARFRITVLPPLDLPSGPDPKADIHAVTERLNALIEGWVRERPEQWLWLHRRWPAQSAADVPSDGHR